MITWRVMPPVGVAHISGPMTMSVTKLLLWPMAYEWCDVSDMMYTSTEQKFLKSLYISISFPVLSLCHSNGILQGLLRGCSFRQRSKNAAINLQLTRCRVSKKLTSVVSHRYLLVLLWQYNPAKADRFIYYKLGTKNIKMMSGVFMRLQRNVGTHKLNYSHLWGDSLRTRACAGIQLGAERDFIHYHIIVSIIWIFVSVFNNIIWVTG